MGLFDWIRKLRGISNYEAKRDNITRRITELIRFKRDKEKDLTKPTEADSIPWLKSSKKEKKPLKSFEPVIVKVNKTMIELQEKRIKELEKKKEETKNKILQLFITFENTIQKENVEEASNIISTLFPLIEFVKDKELSKRLSTKINLLKEVKQELFNRELERKKKEEEKKREEERLRLEAEKRKQEQIEAERLERERRAKEYEEQKLQEEKRILEERNRLKTLTIRRKPDAERIINYLVEKGVSYFYHFTDRENIRSIRKHGGLYSWLYCENNGIQIPNAGGDSTSRLLDRRHGIEDYVRLSFCDDHPMAYRLQQDGASLVLLKIKIEVAGFLETQFSDINAADNNVSHGTGYEHLRNVNINATKRKYLKKTDPDFKEHQAECMIKTFLPLEYIVNIDNPQPL